MSETELPVVCNLNALDAGERSQQSRLFASLAPRVQETRETNDGFAFRLPADALMEAAELMGLERRCCSFLELKLEARASEPHVWLSLSGPPGTKDVLRAELPLTPTPQPETNGSTE